MFHNLSKDERELHILKLIYKVEEFCEIKKREEPDFELKMPSDKIPFAVEITEFYFSGSNARLKNIPTYFDEIMSNKRYRHKKDKKTLAVNDLTLISDRGDEHLVEGIVQEVPPIETYSNLVAEIIEIKNKKFENYDNRLNHINLIVYDTENRLIGENSKLFYHLFYKEKLKETLINSPFREIFYITRFDKYKEVWLPLKLIYLVSELYLLNSYINSSKNSLKIDKYNNELELYGEYLHRKGIKNLFTIETSSNYEIIWGNYGILIQNGNSVIIHDYREHQIPAQAQMFVNRVGQEATFNRDTLEDIKKHLCENIFETDIAFNVNEF
jgi:hypothetical protein